MATPQQTFRFTAETRKRLRILAAHRDMSMSEYLREIINERWGRHTVQQEANTDAA